MNKKRRTLFFEGLFETLGFVFLIGIWILISFLLEREGNYLFPGPVPVFSKLGVLFVKEAKITFSAIGWTLLRVIIGWSLSFVAALVLGTLGGLYKYVDRFLKPFVVISRVMPTAAIVIILIGIFFQYEKLPDYIPSFLVFFVAFPLIYEAFYSGVKNEPQEINDALDLEGGGHKSLHAVIRVIWPDSMPYVALAITQSFGLSFKVSIMSEVISSSSATHSGIGTLISISKSYVEMDSVIAYSLISIILVLLIDILLYFFKKRFVPEQSK